jgi:hypothetical protein
VLVVLVVLACIAALPSSCSVDAPAPDPSGLESGRAGAGANDVQSCDQPGETICGDQCVDTETDVANCGGCGNQCPTGDTCAAGTCSCDGCVFGNYDDLGSNSEHLPNYLLGTAVVVPETVLVSFGVIGRAAGPHFEMALYRDAGGSPGALVASTPSTPLAVGRQEIGVSPVALSAGTYWIMGIYDTEASIGIAFGGSAPVDYTALGFGSALPGTFPSPDVYSGQTFNYYIVVHPSAAAASAVKREAPRLASRASPGPTTRSPLRSSSPPPAAAADR